MMGFGFLLMLLVVVLPILGVIALVVWLVNTNRFGNPFGENPPSEKRGQVESQGTNRTCSHCGTSLQVDWIHCPQCGAGIGS